MWPSRPPTLAERGNADGRQRSGLPFGYHVEYRADSLILLRPDRSFVAAFGAMGADPFEVEAAVWEDAD
jgi:hypothetical protein